MSGSVATATGPRLRQVHGTWQSTGFIMFGSPSFGFLLLSLIRALLGHDEPDSYSRAKSLEFGDRLRG